MDYSITFEFLSSSLSLGFPLSRSFFFFWSFVLFVSSYPLFIILNISLKNLHLFPVPLFPKVSPTQTLPFPGANHLYLFRSAISGPGKRTPTLCVCKYNLPVCYLFARGKPPANGKVCLSKNRTQRNAARPNRLTDRTNLREDSRPKP